MPESPRRPTGNGRKIERVRTPRASSRSNGNPRIDLQIDLKSHRRAKYRPRGPPREHAGTIRPLTHSIIGAARSLRLPCAAPTPAARSTGGRSPELQTGSAKPDREETEEHSRGSRISTRSAKRDPPCPRGRKPSEPTMGAFFLRDVQRVTKLAVQRHSIDGRAPRLLAPTTGSSPARSRPQQPFISTISARPSKAERMLSSNVSAGTSSEVIRKYPNEVRRSANAPPPGVPPLSIGTIFRFQSWIPDVGLRRFFRLATTGPDTLGCGKRER